MSANTNSFDLGEYKASQMEVADVKIVHPLTGEPTSIVIQVLSTDSDSYRKLSMRLQNENLKFSRKNRGKTSAEKFESDAIELLVGATHGWSGLKENGKELAFSAETCRRIYTEFPFIREQVDEFLGDRRNFIKA